MVGVEGLLFQLLKRLGNADGFPQFFSFRFNLKVVVPAEAPRDFIGTVSIEKVKFDSNAPSVSHRFTLIAQSLQGQLVRLRRAYVDSEKLLYIIEYLYVLCSDRRGSGRSSCMLNDKLFTHFILF